MKKRFSGPQIVAKLRQADVLIGQGKTVPRNIEQHYFRKTRITGYRLRKVA